MEVRKNNNNTHIKSLSLMLSRLRQHVGMDPKESQPHHGTLKRASVLVVITNDSKILLTKRSQNLKSHPGQVCFPGGKQDPNDNKNDIATAIRETHEEVGLSFSSSTTTTTTTSPPAATTTTSKLLSELEPICILRTIESINHLCVTPIVMYTQQTSVELTNHIKLNPTEVDAAFWVPLEFFTTTAPIEEYEVPWSGETFIYRKYLFIDDDYCCCSEQQQRPPKEQQYEITGLTAHIAHEVAHLSSSLEDDDADDCSNNNNKVDTYGSEDRNGKSNKEGYLWRLQDDHRRPYWNRYYFVLSQRDKILHQYANKEQADRKSQSANKKNRLRMDGSTQIFVNDDATAHDVDAKTTTKEMHSFDIHILDGRVIWRLAASKSESRQNWMTTIQSVIPNK